MQITPLDAWIANKTAAFSPGGGSDLSRAGLEAWQLHKLNETLALAHQKSPFYRQHFNGLPQSIDSLAGLSQFPLTSPEQLRANPLRFVCVSQDEIQRVVTLQSSGTTGEPKRLYFTSDDQELTIDFFGVGMSTFTQPGDRVLIFLPGETPGSVGDLLRLGLQRLGREPLPYGPVRDPLDALEKINKLRVNCLVGSPTQMLGLARRARQPGLAGSPSFAPDSVLLSTDYVPAAITRELEDTWGCRVFNHYGATEMGLGGGVECQAHLGLHLREADLYFEVLDPNSGAPLSAGEKQYGEVVFTTLTRRGMPLIRYRIGDRSRFIRGNCPCGTALKTMEAISGRFSGFVQVGDRLLRLPEFDEALFPIPGLLNFNLAVSGQPGQEALQIEAHMLTSEPAAHLIQAAIQSLAGLDQVTITIDCKHNPKEAGSLLKRVILDRRGA